MVTFKKYSLQQLRKNYPVLSKEELKEWIGGYKYEYSQYGIRVYDDEGNFLRFMSYDYCEDNYGEDWMSEGVSISMGSGMDPLNISPVSSEEISGSETTMQGYNWYQTEKHILEKCSAEQLEMLDKLNVRIERVDSLTDGAYGQYDPKHKVIYLLDSNQYSGDNEFYTFKEELFHAFQQSIGNDLDYKSCVEFQANFIRLLLMSYDTKGGLAYTIVEDEKQLEALDWFSEITHDFDRSKPISISAFESKVDYFYELFLIHNQGKPYGANENQNYNYNWRRGFSFMGIKFK